MPLRPSACCPWCDKPIPSDEVEKVRADIATKEQKLQTQIREQIAREHAQALTKLENAVVALQRQLEEPRRIGRPTKPPAPNERVPVALRVTPEIKIRLDTAAKKGGRSLSQEAEIRLERSFEREDLLTDILKIAFGNKVAGLVLLMAQAMVASAAGGTSSTELQSETDQRSAWMDDPLCFDRATTAALVVLHQLHPQGLEEDFVLRGDSNIPWAMIAALRGEQSSVGIPYGDTIETIRKLLGPLADRKPSSKLPIGHIAEVVPFGRRRSMEAG